MSVKSGATHPAGLTTSRSKCLLLLDAVLARSLAILAVWTRFHAAVKSKPCL